jgi:Ca2+-binding RTX toxin-like protein
MVTLPAGSEPQVAFISGVTSDAKVAGVSYSAWDFRSNPPTYGLGDKDEWSGALKWGGSTLSTSGTPGGDVRYWFDPGSTWTTAEQNALLSGLHLWSAVANVVFNAAASADKANFVFVRNNDGRAFANLPGYMGKIGSSVMGSPFDKDGKQNGQGTISIDTTGTAFGPIGDPALAASFNEAGGYVYDTIVHEVGHMLGLGHGGAYDASDGLPVPARQFGVYDTRLWTIMSYINPDDSTAAFFDSYPVTGTEWGQQKVGDKWWDRSPTTPMMLDILAIQRLYGAPTAGPLVGGNKVFGFNCNIPGDVGRYFDFNVNSNPVVTLWATGSNNTLDVSGYAEDAVVNLYPGTISSVHGMVHNVAIGTDVLIQHAIGGAGTDTIWGNWADNYLDQGAGGGTMFGFEGNDTLEAGSGPDHLDGGVGIDAVSYYGSDGELLIDTTVGKVVGGWGTGDTLVGIEDIRGSNFGDRIATGAAADTIWGGAGADQLDGREGDDSLFGESGNDTIRGGLGADFIGGGSDDDTVTYAHAVYVNLQNNARSGEAVGDIYVSIETFLGSDEADTFVASNLQGARFAGGGAGDSLYGGDQGDWLQGGLARDYLHGGAGNDIASYADMPAEITAELYFSDGTTDGKITGGDYELDTLVSIESVEGTGYDDRLLGDERDNLLSGIGGNDYLDGDAGGGPLGSADTLLGGVGNDTVLMSVNDQAIGGEGSDTATFAGGAIHLDFPSVWFTVGGQYIYLREFETYVGTDLDDAVYGAAHGETISLGAGNDTLYGGFGDDFLVIGPGGVDWMDGGPGFDTMVMPRPMVASWQTGQLDADIAGDPWANWEAIQGSSGDDIIRTNSWGYAIELRGGGGNDQLATGVTGVVGDTLRGEAGDDTLDGGAGDDVLDGGEGDDFLIIGPGTDVMDGGPGFDVMVMTRPMVASWQTGVVDPDAAESWANWEAIQGSGGDDVIRTNSWGYPIELRGGGGNDQLATGITGAVADTLRGEDGNDTLDGGAGNDTVDGGEGDDQLRGGPGDDLLAPGANNDIVDGGDGIDTASYADATRSIRLDLALTTPQATGGGGLDTLVQIENAEGGTKADTIVGTNASNGLRGGGGNDALDGLGGSDTVDGGAGNDTLTGAGGNDTLLGGDGADLLRPGRGNDSIDGGAGRDTVSYADLAVPVVVDLSLTGPQPTGVAGLDTITGVENLEGGGGADTLTGSASANTLTGLGGDDVITGLRGIDLLLGGPGADRFVYRALADARFGAALESIGDFENGIDRIDLTAIDGDIGTPGLQSLTYVGGPFTAAAQVRFDAGVLLVNANADPTAAEMAIALTGVLAFDPGSLLLAAAAVAASAPTIDPQALLEDGGAGGSSLPAGAPLADVWLA